MLDEVVFPFRFNEDMETLVMLHVNGPEKDGRRLDLFFQKISAVGNAPVKPGSTSFRRYSYLIIKSVSVSPAGAIREGEDFVVSCTVLGSPDKKFKWFKDGLIVNTNTTRSETGNPA